MPLPGYTALKAMKGEESSIVSAHHPVPGLCSRGRV